MKVFVLDTTKQPKDPIHPAKARCLLDQGKAAVFRFYPFTIILKERLTAASAPLRLKIDPGSRTTGIAILNDTTGEIVFAAELKHRGQRIKRRLDARRAIRRNRRQRNTRYRKPRFLNRTRPKGWLAPSLKSRVYNIETWVNRLRKICNIKAISLELVRFDTQLIQNPEISGMEYQRGTLYGYELWEYLLEKWGRKCAYCGKKDIPLEKDHITAKANGGSNRSSNFTVTCRPCNKKKGKMPVEIFLKDKPETLKKILAHSKAPLHDATAINSTRWDLLHTLKKTGLPVEVGTGGRTKYNRTLHGLPKAHWLDAACVGASTPEKRFQLPTNILRIKAMGHGSRQMCKMDKYGFPRSAPKLRDGRVKGFKSGDMIKAVVSTGKKTGTHVGRISVRKRGTFDIKTKGETVQGIHWRWCRKLQGSDGYMYTYA